LAQDAVDGRLQNIQLYLDTMKQMAQLAVVSLEQRRLAATVTEVTEFTAADELARSVRGARSSCALDVAADRVRRCVN